MANEGMERPTIASESNLYSAYGKRSSKGDDPFADYGSKSKSKKQDAGPSNFQKEIANLHAMISALEERIKFTGHNGIRVEGTVISLSNTAVADDGSGHVFLVEEDGQPIRFFVPGSRRVS